MTRDYLTVKVWDLNMESKPLETYQVPFTRVLIIALSVSIMTHKKIPSRKIILH